MGMRYQKSIQVCVLVLVACAIGCSNQPATYQVNGKLEFEDGSPVKFGTIEFLSREHSINARGKIERDGSFSLTTYHPDDGAVAGTHQVTIQQFATIPLTANQEMQIEHNHGKLVSESYRNYDQTDLEVTIESGINDIKLIVQSIDE